MVRLSGLAVDPVDVHGDLGLRHVAFVIAEQAENRIGEPDRAVGFHHDVVRRVQPLAVEGIHQHGDRTVIFGSHDAASAMLAGDQPSLAVAGVAVGEIRRLAVDADRAGFLFPFDDALVGNVAAQQIAPVAEPHRTFGPAQSRGQPLHGRELQPVFFKARIERMDRGIGILRRRLTAGACGFIGHLLFSLLLRIPRRGHLLSSVRSGGKQRCFPVIASASEAIQCDGRNAGLLRRFAPRNDDEPMHLAAPLAPRHTLSQRCENEG